MFVFEKRTQIPVCIKNRNPRLASQILSQYGGVNGELSASLTYLSQRFTMPCNMGKALLTDIGTEELAHLEIMWITEAPYIPRVRQAFRGPRDIFSPWAIR